MIEEYLNNTATLKRAGTVAADGSRTYTTETIVCRFEPKTQQVLTSKGETVVSNARIFTTTAVRVGDAVVFDGRTWPVIAVFVRYAMMGISHYEVLL